ncbi:MAG: peptide chain release factor N(5)-glutamine methyltransferase [Leptospirales bacterium]
MTEEVQKGLPEPDGTVLEWISWGERMLCELPEDGNREARSFLAEILSDPIAPWTRWDMPLTPEQSALYKSWIHRRSGREPFHLVTGSIPFMGRSFRIGPGVLVPRPETEILLASVLELFASGKPARILDLGCGSGVLIVSLLAMFPESLGVAVDRWPSPLSWTIRNAQLNNVGDRLQGICGDWTEMLGSRATFDLLVSNPPYIPTNTIPSLSPEVRLFDPMEALDGGTDGLDFYRRLLPVMPDLLNPGGVAAVEIGGDQGSFFKAPSGRVPGCEGPWIVRDVGGQDRVVIWKKG